MTMACEIVAGDPEEWKDIAEEVTYGGSRVEVGGGRLRGDGSIGAWAADFVRKWGVVARGVYGSIDLSAYSESRCREFGSRGVPDDLEAKAKLHPVTDVAQVRTWEEAKKALASGYGIAICSQQGFRMQRDANGVCAPSGSWAHCMALIGYAPINGKECGFIENSWGANAHTGPLGPGDPMPSGFYADASVIERMLKQNDSWAFAKFQGFPARDLPIDWKI
jgi:hypothetical protein